MADPRDLIDLLVDNMLADARLEAELHHELRQISQGMSDEAKAAKTQELAFYLCDAVNSHPLRRAHLDECSFEKCLAYLAKRMGIANWASKWDLLQDELDDLMAEETELFEADDFKLCCPDC